METKINKRKICTKKTKRKQDLFTNLPSEIITEILSRIPVQSILSCKCVCKLWHDLVETNEFAKSHLSKSVCGLALSFTYWLSLSVTSNLKHKTIELTNVLDLQHSHLDDLHFSTITRLDFVYTAYILGSADGLLLLRIMKRSGTYDLYLRNPITGENINLHSPNRVNGLKYPGRIIIYGFGVSRITGQYKAVSIFHYPIDMKTRKLSKPPVSDYKVYTIGTGFWRSITPHVVFRHIENNKGAFVNGNLHWFVYDVHDTPWICCFDLESELFSTFSPPPLQDVNNNYMVLVVEGSLCLCYPTSSDRRITIWLMKEYGVEKSWTNKFIIELSPDIIGSILVYPIRISKDGLIFMAYQSLF